ncbi:helix-turn-helix domain-containing protein [Streptomyces chrestomyceticus]|uniref:helix-turn-helix domain-containing protein n=1 Tax=Streptomyces chrestomyceticus TaxID=68185 RepID=UPI0033E6CB4F
MGRPEAPVDYTVPELGALAAHLRVLRAAVGLTYAALAEITNYSAATLKRAAAGKTLPAYRTALAYAAACDGPVNETAELHLRAEWALAHRNWEARRSTVRPAPQFARDPADLSGALRDAYRQAGRPSLRAMEVRSQGVLPRSSAHAIVNGRALPMDVRQYLAFLEACGIFTEDALLPWCAAWLKVRDNPCLDRHQLHSRSRSTAVEHVYADWLDEVAPEVPVPAVLLGDPVRVNGNSRLSAVRQALLGSQGCSVSSTSASNVETAA